MPKSFDLNQAIRAVGGNPAVVNDIFVGPRNRPHSIPLVMDGWEPNWFISASVGGLGSLEIDIVYHPPGYDPNASLESAIVLPEHKLGLGYNMKTRQLGLATEAPNPIPFIWYQTPEELIHAATPRLDGDTVGLEILRRMLAHVAS